MKIGIYKIINTSNNKVYIGSSQNVDSRLKEHYRKLKTNKHHSKHLQNASNLYGLLNFKFEIIEELNSLDLLEMREQYWCDFYKANNRKFGYNVREITSSNRGNKIKVSDQAKINISKSLKGKIPKNLEFIRVLQKRPVDMYINNIYIQTFESQYDAAKYLNIKHHSINNYVRGVTKNIRGYKNYHFIYSDGNPTRIIKYNEKSKRNYGK